LGIRHNPFVPTGKVLSLDLGEEIRDLEFRLVAAGAFVGTVLDEDRNSLSGIEVQALVKATALSQLRRQDLSSMPNLELVPLGRAITNDRGEYRLYGLPPGDYFLSAVDSGMPRLTESVLYGGIMFSPADLSRTKYPPIYHPGTPEKARAVAVPLDSGGEKRVDFRLQRYPTRRIQGQVIGPDGKPGVGVFIHLTPLDMATLFSGFHLGNQSDQQGKFEIANVPPGEYFVRASRIRYEGQEQIFSDVRVDVREQDVYDLKLVLGRGQKLRGKIHPEGDPTFDLDNLHVWLTPVDDEAHHIHTGSAHVKTDGSFETRELAETTYRIHLTGLPERWYLKTARVAGGDTLQNGLKISEDAAWTELEVLIAPDGACLAGTVLMDNRPVPGAMAILQLLPESHHGYTARGSTDQNGRFEFRGVPPGPCRLRISATPAELVMFEEQLKDLRTTSLSVTVKPGEQRVLTLNL
jgi:carboxypeptidase family protein